MNAVRSFRVGNLLVTIDRCMDGDILAARWALECQIFHRIPRLERDAHHQEYSEPLKVAAQKYYEHKRNCQLCRCGIVRMEICDE